MRTTIASALLLAATPVAAADWWLAAVGDDLVVFVDRDSVNRTGSKAKLWKHTFLRKPDKNGSVSAKIQTVVDCEDRSEAFQYLVIYNADDSVKTIQGNKIFDPIPPDSIAEGVLLGVCSDDWILEEGIDSPIDWVKQWRTQPAKK